MKILIVQSLFVGAMFTCASCNKTETGESKDVSSNASTIEFVLFTSKDFSRYHDKVSFTLSIRSNSNRVLWDSLLPQMKIKDIPAPNQKLVIRKTIPNPDCAPLKVGFLYYVEDVGVSWFWDGSEKGEQFKKVEFDFH